MDILHFPSGCRRNLVMLSIGSKQMQQNQKVCLLWDWTLLKRNLFQKIGTTRGNHFRRILILLLLVRLQDFQHRGPRGVSLITKHLFHLVGSISSNFEDVFILNQFVFPFFFFCYIPSDLLVFVNYALARWSHICNLFFFFSSFRFIRYIHWLTFNCS